MKVVLFVSNGLQSAGSSTGHGPRCTLLRNVWSCMRYEVLAATGVQIVVLWAVIPYNFIGDYLHFGGALPPSLGSTTVCWEGNGCSGSW